MPLDVDALVQIMTEPRNALVKQYRKFFEMEGADLEFTPEALIEIAKRAKAKDTGARGLRSIVEEIMLDIMYELPDRAGQGEGPVRGHPRGRPQGEEPLRHPARCR